MLLLSNVEFSRTNKVIFSEINLSASPGKIILIKGKNGSGKTTMIKTILNIVEPTSGEIFWSGKKTNKDLFNFYNNLTFIMDNPTSSRDLTVIENISFWKNLSLSKVSYDKIKKVLGILELKEYLNTQTRYLSSGEIRKLELTRLIIEQKKLWILDEPYNHLDMNSIEIINQTFNDHLHNDGIILLSSNYLPKIDNLEIFSIDKL